MERNLRIISAPYICLLVEHSYCHLTNNGEIRNQIFNEKYPVPSKESYQLNVIDKIESFVKSIRWRAFYCLNQQKCDNEIKQNLGVKTGKYPPTKDLSDMAELSKLIHVKDSFQSDLKKDILMIKSFPNVFVFARQSK